MKIKLAQFGLGPIGLETLRAAASKPWVKVVGAVDIAPAKVGRDLGELTGLPALQGRRVHRSFGELAREDKPDVVLHTSVSGFEEAYEQLVPIARSGVGVVSSCEELLFPWLRNPALAARLDALCKRSGARVVGTGVNPGFVMDVLPLCLTGVSVEVKAVHVQRVVNAATRRGPLQKKIGSGQDPEVFARLLRQGKAGHAGLKESLALIAHCLGWKLSRLTEKSEPVVAQRRLRTPHFTVEKGQVCGIHQRAEGCVSGQLRVTLDIQMYLGAKNPRDSIQVEGQPPLDLVIRGGVAGDQATIAALLNTAARILDAKPGLRLMTDLSLPRSAV